MSLTYSSYVTTIANIAVVDEGSLEFQQIISSMIDFAEQRIYRELDLLSTVTRQTGILTVGTRTFDLPTSNGRFVVTNGFNVITPSTETTPDDGTRNRLVPTTLDALDAFWPSTTGAALPTSYAMVTDQQIVVGPPPDAAYTIECIGTIRPTPLSASNIETYLTLYLPDLFIAASMIFMSGYLKNFSAMADQPQMATSWESEYQRLFASANVEEQRKRYASGAWGSLQPTTIATPNR